MNERGTRATPGVIVTAIVDRLRAARRATYGSPLVVVAHSMGGNIMYDILSYYEPELRVDVLLTVGAQVGLFEELCLLQVREARCPPLDRVAGLSNVVQWLNVFDHNDVLGFAAQRIFSGVQDFAYSTGKGLLAAHSSYFALPSFFRRLADRLGG